jgi:type I restriction enzyme R subunit
MFDFVGVADYHGDDDDFADGGVVSDSKKRKKYEPRRLLALDIDDHIDPTTRAWITVDEDGNMVFPDASQQRAAELGARFESWLLQRTDLGAGEETWLRMVGNQLRCNADHYVGDEAEFSLDQFAFHPFSQLGGLPQALRVFGRRERVDELLASLNQAVFGGETGADAVRSAAAATPPPTPH